MTHLPTSEDHFDSITDMPGIEAARAARDERGRLRTSDSLYRNRLEARMFQIAEGDAGTQPAAVSGAAKVAAFVEEFTGRPQRPDGVDQSALDRLHALRREKGPKADSVWLAKWERDLAAVLQGQQPGEAVKPPGASGVAVPAGVDVEDAEAFDRLTDAARDAGIAPDTLSGILQAVAEVAEQPPGEQWTEAPFEMFGYRVAVPGVSINRADPQIYAGLKAASQAGLSQSAVDRLLGAFAGGGAP